MPYLPSSVQPRQTLLSSMLLLALIAMLLAGCGVSTVEGRNAAKPAATPTATSLPTPAPTMTPAVAHPLQWQTRTLPAPFSSGYGGIALGFSPLDSMRVWACVPSASSATIWISYDRAVSWQQVATVQENNSVTACSITPDDLDPATAVLQTSFIPNVCCLPPAQPYPMRVTHDGGKTWAVFHGSDATLRQISTLHGVTFALFAPVFADMTPFSSDFVVSRNGLQSWQTMDGDLQKPGSSPIDSGFVRQFWVNPATGDILAQTSTSVVYTDHFYASNDSGSTWQDLHAPAADQFLVRQPYAAGLWEICGVRTSYGGRQGSWNNTIPCTLDSGIHWNTRTITPIHGAFAIADDGSVLGLTGSSLMRLTPGGKDWDSLGPLNTIYLPPNAYVTGTGKGVIWNLPDTNEQDHNTTVYVASYN